MMSLWVQTFRRFHIFSDIIQPFIHHQISKRLGGRSGISFDNRHNKCICMIVGDALNSSGYC